MSIESLDLLFQVQHSPFWTNLVYALTFYHWIFFLFSCNKVSDANIGIIAILVHFEKKPLLLLVQQTKDIFCGIRHLLLFFLLA